MYVWPVIFPAQSNREDLLQTVALFDDNTGQPIDLRRATLARPGNFTGANWTVTDGGIITNSITQLTIPDYPVGNQLQAIALTVGQNLGILAGDPVLIADPTGLNTMTGYVTTYVPSTGALVVQVGVAFDFEIRGHHGDSYDFLDDYGFIGSPDTSTPIIQATLGNGITLIDTGVLQIRIPASTMQQLRHKTYRASLVMFDGFDTRQAFAGKLPIIGGGVSSNAFGSAAATSNPFGLP